jgi:hypothetical protein
METDRTLAELGQKAFEHHVAAKKAWQSSLKHARAAGRALLKAKFHIPRGEWSAWLENWSNGFGVSTRTARVYMQVVKKWNSPQMKLARSRGLSIDSVSSFLNVVTEATKSTMEVDFESERKLLLEQIRRAILDVLKPLSKTELAYFANELATTTSLYTVSPDSFFGRVYIEIQKGAMKQKSNAKNQLARQTRRGIVQPSLQKNRLADNKSTACVPKLASR